jgi:hypothetical protein
LSRIRPLYQRTSNWHKGRTPCFNAPLLLCGLAVAASAKCIVQAAKNEPCFVRIFFLGALGFSNFKLPSFNIRFTHAALRPLPVLAPRIKTRTEQQCSKKENQKRTEKTQKITPQNEWCSFEGVQMLSKPTKGALNNTPLCVVFPLFSLFSRYLFPINWGKNTVLIGNALRKYTYKRGESLIFYYFLTNGAF